MSVLTVPGSVVPVTVVSGAVVYSTATVMNTQAAECVVTYQNCMYGGEKWGKWGKWKWFWLKHKHYGAQAHCVTQLQSCRCGAGQTGYCGNIPAPTA